jgi:hypothetical protein
MGTISLSVAGWQPVPGFWSTGYVAAVTAVASHSTAVGKQQMQSEAALATGTNDVCTCRANVQRRSGPAAPMIFFFFFAI